MNGGVKDFALVSNPRWLLAKRSLHYCMVFPVEDGWREFQRSNIGNKLSSFLLLRALRIQSVLRWCGWGPGEKLRSVETCIYRWRWSCILSLCIKDKRLLFVSFHLILELHTLSRLHLNGSLDLLWVLIILFNAVCLDSCFRSCVVCPLI